MKATTEEQRKRCFDILVENGQRPLTDEFFYLEEDGEVTAVMGLVYCTGNKSAYLQIEPMWADNQYVAFQLYEEVMDYAMQAGGCLVIAQSDDKAVQNALERLGWTQINSDLKTYSKDLQWEAKQKSHSSTTPEM